MVVLCNGRIIDANPAYLKMFGYDLEELKNLDLMQLVAPEWRPGVASRHSVRAVPATIIDGRLTFVGVPPRQSAEKALQLKMKPQGA